MMMRPIDYKVICDNRNINYSLDERIFTEASLDNSQDLYICLTFDDGPTIEYTPLILDLLQEYGAKATFFVLGEFVEYYPDIACRIAEEGHELGNHTFSHPDLTLLSTDELKKEILRTQQIVHAHTNKHCSLFRPTYGVFYNETVNYVEEELGLGFVLWSRDMLIKDWELPGSDVLSKRIDSNAKSGSVVLLHDGGGNREQTVETLKHTLPNLIKQGYQFITVSEMIELSNYNKCRR